MARRLSENQKQELVDSYRAGKSTSSLAATFGCSPNTVSRIVKALIPSKEYSELKANRARGPLSSEEGANGQLEAISPLRNEDLPLSSVTHLEQLNNASNHLVDSEPKNSNEINIELSEHKSLALDDADDFGSVSLESSSDNGEVEKDLAEFSQIDSFQELVPLNDGILFKDRDDISCEPLSSGSLPLSVYMLVDKEVELDAKPLKEFPELSFLPDVDLERIGICLFSSPRSAKRLCGRSQRVIKVPDTKVFELSAPYLLARGITRLVIEGSLIALDE